MLVWQWEEVQALSRSLNPSVEPTASTIPSQVLDWEGCFNVRELGGMAAQNGRRTRWGAVVRSDLPARLTEAGRHALVDHGVRTIIDLRSPGEVEQDAEGYALRTAAAQEAARAGVRYLNLPLSAGRSRDSDDEQRIHALYEAATSRSELTRLDLELNWRGAAAAAAAIADAEPGAVLVHCHAGKDRTGIVVAVLLSLIGVSDDEVADDYALTASNIEPLIAEWLDTMSTDPAERERLRGLAMPGREAMLDTLTFLRQRYGSAEAYLRLGGLTDAQLQRLRARLVENA